MSIVLRFLQLWSDTSSERAIYGPTNLRSASPINIDIDFKSCGLKWNGKDVVSTLQLQQMKADKKNKVVATKSVGISKNEILL